MHQFSFDQLSSRNNTSGLDCPKCHSVLFHSDLDVLRYRVAIIFLIFNVTLIFKLISYNLIHLLILISTFIYVYYAYYYSKFVIQYNHKNSNSKQNQNIEYLNCSETHQALHRSKSTHCPVCKHKLPTMRRLLYNEACKLRCLSCYSLLGHPGWISFTKKLILILFRFSIIWIIFGLFAYKIHVEGLLFCLFAFAFSILLELSFNYKIIINKKDL